MKILFKNKKIKNIILVLVGIVLGSSIGITANYLLKAEDVEYTDPNNNSTTVQNAITDLYSKAKSLKNKELVLDTATVAGVQVTAPFVGNYSEVYCVYGTDENYGNIGTISGNNCVFSGNAGTEYKYKILAMDTKGEVYENHDRITTSSGMPLTALKLGDYVYYKPASTSYLIQGSDTGCVNSVTCGSITDGSPQEINPSLLDTWRVVGINEYGATRLISEYTTPESIYFYGQTGYQNYIDVLYQASQAYINSGIINMAWPFGWNNSQTKRITKTTELTRTSKPWSTDTNSSTTSANEALGAGDELYIYDYNIVKNALGKVDATLPDGTKTNYWVSSRYYYGSGDLWGFSGRYVYNDPIGAGADMHFNTLKYRGNTNKFSEKAYGIPFRPIVFINGNSSVKIVDGTGTASDPYKLGL